MTDHDCYDSCDILKTSNERNCYMLMSPVPVTCCCLRSSPTAWWAPSLGLSLWEKPWESWGWFIPPIYGNTYPLVMTTSLLLRIAVEMVSFPVRMVIVHGFLYVYQRILRMVYGSGFVCSSTLSKTVRDFDLRPRDVGGLFTHLLPPETGHTHQQFPCKRSSLILILIQQCLSFIVFFLVIIYSMLTSSAYRSKFSWLVSTLLQLTLPCDYLFLNQNHPNSIFFQRRILHVSYHLYWNICWVPTKPLAWSIPFSFRIHHKTSQAMSIDRHRWTWGVRAVSAAGLSTAGHSGQLDAFWSQGVPSWTMNTTMFHLENPLKFNRGVRKCADFLGDFRHHLQIFVGDYIPNSWVMFLLPNSVQLHQHRKRCRDVRAVWITICVQNDGGCPKQSWGYPQSPTIRQC